MTDVAIQAEWDKTWGVFEGLWPTAQNLTNTQITEWKARLRYLNQQKVRGALRNVFAKVRFPKNPPPLSDVLSAYEALRDPGGSERMQPRSVNDEQEWAALEREADVARLVLKELSLDDLNRHKKTACRTMAMLKGFNTPPGDKVAASAHEQVAGGVASRLVESPDNWSSQFVLCVRAAMASSRMLKSASTQTELGRGGETAAQRRQEIVTVGGEITELDIPF